MKKTTFVTTIIAVMVGLVVWSNRPIARELRQCTAEWKPTNSDHDPVYFSYAVVCRTNGGEQVLVSRVVCTNRINMLLYPGQYELEVQTIDTRNGMRSNPAKLSFSL